MSRLSYMYDFKKQIQHHTGKVENKQGGKRLEVNNMVLFVSTWNETK